MEHVNVRVAGTHDDPLFCAKDICLILGLDNVSRAVSRLQPDEKIITGSNTIKGKQQMTFITESGLYRLIFTSKKKEAEDFKTWVFSEVLPSIRKTGSFELEKAKERELELLAEVERKEKEVATLNRQKLILSSYFQNMTSLTKNQVFYLATTRAYALQCRFEFGGVKNAKDLRARLYGYNTGRAEGDLIYFCKTVKCHDYKLVEERIHTILKQFKDKNDGKKEMVRLRYDLLETVVDLICDNFDKEISLINEQCQEFLNATVYSEPIIPEPIDLGDYIEISHRQNGQRKETRLVDITGWTDEQIHSKIEELVELCALEHEQVVYNFREHKDTVPLNISWSMLSSYMKKYKGLKMNEWRQLFKHWFQANKPAQLTVKGLRISSE